MNQPSVPHLQGLTAAQAAQALARHGPNALPEAKPVTLMQRLLRQFRSPLIYILLVALLVDLGIWIAEGAAGVPVGSLAIALILLINAGLGVYQESKAELAVAGPVPEPLVLAELSVRREDFVRAAAALMASVEVASPGFDAQRLRQSAAEENRVYESLKAGLLQAAAQGRIGLPVLDAHMQDIGRQHRTVKAAQRIAPLRQPG